jgi:hypothetical protein
VIQFTGNRLRAAFRVKTGLTRSRPQGGKPAHEWGGKWDWAWMLDKKLPAAPKPAEHP